MTELILVRVCLAALFIWCCIVHWCLFVRESAGWKRLTGKKPPKKRKRPAKKKKEPKPFEGLTRQPVCELCAAQTETPQGATQREPPPQIKHKRGRRRTVDTRRHFCPEQQCRYFGWLGKGNIVSNGHPNGGPWRQLNCVVCGKYFQETLGTVFYGSSVAPEDIMRAIATLCEGVSPRKVARIFEVDKDTVLRWLVQAASHSEAVIAYMIHDLHLSQVQMDELYAVLSEMGSADDEKRVCWVWVAIDPLSKLLLSVAVGDRNLAMAQQLVHGVASVLAPGVVPLFLTDQLAAYGRALLTHFGLWIEKVSLKSGRTLRRWVPDERLRYAQVRKRRRRCKIVAVTSHVVFGSTEAVRSILAASGHKINTAFIERVNRTLRARVPGLARRAEGLAQSKQGLHNRLILVMGFYNLCLPHHSLRTTLPKPLPTKGSGSPKKWLPGTPAMAAGITNHIWSMREFLLFRVPPWRQEATTA